MDAHPRKCMLVPALPCPAFAFACACACAGSFVRVGTMDKRTVDEDVRGAHVVFRVDHLKITCYRRESLSPTTQLFEPEVHTVSIMPTSSFPLKAKRTQNRKNTFPGFSHTPLLRNRLVREFLERFPEKEWNDVIKFSAIAGIQSFVLLEKDEHVPLTAEVLEGHVVKGGAALALKENFMEIARQQEQMRQEHLAAQAQAEEEFVRAFVPEEKPQGGRLLGKFPFVDDGSVQKAITGDFEDIPYAAGPVEEVETRPPTAAPPDMVPSLKEVRMQRAGKVAPVMVKKIRRLDGLYDDPNSTTPDWWPNDAVTEMLNKGVFEKVEKKKKRAPPRMAYSVPEEPEAKPDHTTVVDNDLVTTEYLSVPSSGYRDMQTYAPPVDKTSRPPVKIEVAKPIKKKKTQVTDKVDAYKVPAQYKNVSSKVKAQVAAYKKAAIKAKVTRHRMLEKVMNPTRDILPEREFNLPTDSTSDEGNYPTLDSIADAFLREYNDVDGARSDSEEEGAARLPSSLGTVSPKTTKRGINTDPWADADVYVPVTAPRASILTKPNPKFDFGSKTNDVGLLATNIMEGIEIAADTEREVHARRYKPSYSGWVGDFGPVHTRTFSTNVHEDDGEIQSDAQTAEKKEVRSIYQRATEPIQSLNLSDYVASNLDTPLLPLDTKSSPHVTMPPPAAPLPQLDPDAHNVPLLVEEDPSVKRETVEETLRKAEAAMAMIKESEASSDVVVSSLEAEFDRTATIVNTPADTLASGGGTLEIFNVSNNDL